MGDIIAGGLCESSLETTAATLLRRLENPALPNYMRDPANWPAGALEELGDDRGATAAAALREKVVKSFRVLRAAIDDFNPDVILIWSKEQMENFGEDCMPPYCIYAFEEDFKIKRKLAPDREVEIKTHPQAARFLAANLIDAGFDTAYSYKPLHVPLAHTFAGLLSYLDWDEKGIPYPIVPFYVNSLGHLHLTRKGYSKPDLLDPSAPQPWRCFDLGVETARILRASPWRVALIAGSAWSHASYIRESYFLFPDIEFDRALFNDLQAAKYDVWRNLNRDALVRSGNGEFLSWVCLAGALSELQLKPVYLDKIETMIFNSTKVTAVFK